MKSRFLSDEELSKIGNQLSGSAHNIFSTALSTGLRIGDVVKIRKSDIKELAGGGCAVSYTAEKTDKKGIAVVTDKNASEWLLKAKKGRRGYIFPSDRSRSGHITRQAAWKWIKEAAERAGINTEGVSPHSLRKCYAVSLYHDKGLQAAKNALQHSDEAVTAIYAYADVYGKNCPDAPIRWAQINELVDLIIEQLEMRYLI